MWNLKWKHLCVMSVVEFHYSWFSVHMFSCGFFFFFPSPYLWMKCILVFLSSIIISLDFFIALFFCFCEGEGIPCCTDFFFLFAFEEHRRLCTSNIVPLYSCRIWLHSVLKFQSRISTLLWGCLYCPKVHNYHSHCKLLEEIFNRSV